MGNKLPAGRPVQNKQLGAHIGNELPAGRPVWVKQLYKL